MIKKLFYTIIILVFLACLAVGGTLYWMIVKEPGDEISQENIQRILGRESPVFYNDGISPLGVFFADAHRQYVRYADIPETFINAIVAAEDNRYFSHFGFDVVGITRAAIKNIQAGRVVQGGSTLTQQTAKNLFKRKGRSIEEKLKELLYALKLEYHYSKEQILEFYANQFYVSGNGLGLGVAARYYFDKNPEDLSLIESAYIAGSVKRPNYYNPFIKRGAEEARKARERGKVRVAYVLKNMLDLGMIGQSDYNRTLRQEIPFNKGQVGYELDYIMDMVTDAVASDQVTDALAVHGIDNIATSGIRIITSVDKYEQVQILHALRKQLSNLDVRMRGYDRQEVQEELRQTEYRGDTTVEDKAFLFGVVREVIPQGDQPGVVVDFGSKRKTGFIDRDGLMPLVDAWVKWRDQRWSEAQKKDLSAFFEFLRVGDRVWVSVRDAGENDQVLLDLERFPMIKGGAIAMSQGHIAAVAGGVENRFFNRAVYGKRTMGSSYKPFVFAAALQLGWNTADMLSNRRDVFVYQNQAYFPRPDHHIDNEAVSMSWAGVRSENLASVWLTAHLCDHLSRSQLHEVASQVGLAPRVVDGEQEPYRRFRSRIRDQYGIIMDQDALRKAAFRKTLQLIEPDLVFEGLEKEQDVIRQLHYGLGFRKFLDDINAELIGDGTLSEEESKELKLRKRILAKNFLRFSELRRELKAYIDQENTPWSVFTTTDETNSEEMAALFYDPEFRTYVFEIPSLLERPLSVIDRTNFQQYLLGLSPEARQAFIGQVKIGGTISVAALDFLKQHLDSEFERFRKLLPYSMEVLEQVDDYRIMVGLHYLVALGKQMGIESTLEPVLSFPLGSNVVTLLETTRVYEALATGMVKLFREKNGEINNTLAIIERIESEDGLVLYRPEPENLRVLDRETVLAIGHVLENTVKFGTGRYADENVKLQGNGDNGNELDELSLSVPLLGKTGTANRYTNASFYGYLPGLNGKGNALELENGYAVGVYVGFDDNKPMRRRTTRITGAAGALPAWTEIVNGLLHETNYASNMDPVDLSFYGLAIDREYLGQVNLGVSKDTGGNLLIPLKEVDPLNRYEPSIMTFGTLTNGNAFKSRRDFKPFWQVGDVSSAVLAGIVEKDL